MSLFNKLRIFARNAIGYSTKRKIIVIESDDWGAIRMPSRQAFESINKKGLDSSGDSFRYNKYDTLADKNDLTQLLETLFSFRDKQGNHPVITALTIVANPDFDKIRDSEFNEYYYEPFTTTLERYYGSDTPFPLWIEGFQNKVFLPQFHGREHLNVAVWMKALKRNDIEARFAFDHELWGFNNQHPLGITFQSAFELESLDQLSLQAQILQDGLRLFEQLFGYRASYLVTPNSPFNKQLEAVVANEGIRFIFASKIQNEPIGPGITRKCFHYPGQQNLYGQYYLSRNCFFEQSEPGKDWVDSCLNEISMAFCFHKPAVISSHRVNYIGALDPSNRKQGLLQLRELLTNILKIWPDVEFMSSADLGELIAQS
jgi:hypothetical protein